jgi:hypothetical protein
VEVVIGAIATSSTSLRGRHKALAMGALSWRRAVRSLRSSRHRSIGEVVGTSVLMLRVSTDDMMGTTASVTSTSPLSSTFGAGVVILKTC